jgi:acyl-CoA synthetase (AMP-forming)/AMP-acid ligase II
MLYDSWLRVAREFGSQAALVDAPSGRRWTFHELASAGEIGGAGPGRLVFSEAQGAEFIVSVIRAWRQGSILCPLEPAQEVPTVPPGLPEGICHLKLTSATTGVPRLVAFRPEQLAADAANIVRTMGLRPDWPNLAAISLAHSYGFSNLVLPLLLHGVPLILVGAPLPEALRTAAAGHEALTLPAVPALWRMWHRAEAIPSNVQLAISAGAPLPLTLEAEAFAASGLKIHNFYGSSETGGIAYDSDAEPRKDPAEVGAPMHGVEVGISEDGCVEVRGAAVAETYWPPEGTALRAGVFRTSDLGEIRAGRVYLRGRASDMMNLAGRKVSPESIERVLMTHPRVSECLVFGVPSPEPERGEIVAACVAARSGVSQEDLRQFLLTRLPAWQIPREWCFVETLTTSTRGKLSRAEWRQRFLQLSRENPRSG